MSETLHDVLVELAEGNPGALSVLLEICGAGRSELLLKLREAGVKGSAIWTTYKDENGEDLESFMMNLELM